MQKYFFAIVWLCFAVATQAKEKKLNVSSPNGQLRVEVTVGDGIRYSLYDGTNVLMRDCHVGLEIDNGVQTAEFAGSSSRKVSERVEGAKLYRNPDFTLAGNALTVKLKGGVNIEFRAYNEGLAYRFETTGFGGKTYIISNETAEFNFTADHTAYLPYSTNDKKPEAMAFQATYDVAPLSKQANDNLAFTPATIDCGTAKLTIMESDLESYPGMFVKRDGLSLKGWFAPYPKTFGYYPWRVQKYVTATEPYIARCEGNRTFPWRIVGVTHDDTEMPANNLVYGLASANRIGDTSWIEPGLVAWDWWNDWGLSGVDFKAGINMPTYKYFIDFAAKYKLPYIILDEGWYNPKSGDMLTTIDEIDLPALVAYGRERGVKLILWTVFNVLDKQLEAACKKYADMGIAGFKVDFLDRDDQEGVEMIYRIADACAKHHLVLDYHGIYKPTGINRTYPNVINFESVFGMEEAKWTKHDEKDMPLYDVTFPFIRQQAGFVDFTPGGMRNATRHDFQPVYFNPMTMGTRCHQLAMYIVHDSPLTMLADNPTAYEREPAYTQFVASLPTTFDETRILQGELGEYIVTARRKGSTWYVAGQTNWDARDITLALDFLPKGSTYQLTAYTDGINAEKNASDYTTRQATTVDAAHKENFHLASGGGFALVLKKK